MLKNIVPPNNFPALWASAWGEDSYGYWQAFEIKSIRQIMRWIPEGEFLMGSVVVKYFCTKPQELLLS